MIKIFVCEDNDIQRIKLNEIISNYILIEELDMKIALSTNDPDTLISYLNENPKSKGIYFLDIDLQSRINGIELASKIRENDIYGKVIFITTHDEFVPLTFVYKIEALDYIIKNENEDFKKRILESLKQAHNHFYNEKNEKEYYLKIKVGNQLQLFPLSEIMFIETSTNSHKLILHLENRTVQFYDKIANYDIYPDILFRAHKSYIISLKNVLSLNKKERMCKMRNGESIYVSARKISSLSKKLLKIDNE